MTTAELNVELSEKFAEGQTQKPNPSQPPTLQPAEVERSKAPAGHGWNITKDQVVY